MRLLESLALECREFGGLARKCCGMKGNEVLGLGLDYGLS